MKKILFLTLLLSLSVNIQAETKKISELFKQMPDSLMPYLTTNNCLDMIDFREAGMKAEVNNLLDGNSEMTYLSDDSLSIRMSDALRIDMSLMMKDSLQVCVRKTYMNKNSQIEVVVSFYTPNWHLINTTTEKTLVLKRDEEMFKDY
ncbi:DUF3256 family protein [Prevotella sp. E13-17]|uniref:DUF3256 family protein n=1 Tax=Prevotella sp. E13-17 TaxID=2913616 RepID=UPI001EDB814B|nr:DUF3256 family protein [Prevotella sp. E13-17]UKK52252.1 DUF3256 family protein [Prevotella sp. E13-17]